MREILDDLKTMGALTEKAVISAVEALLTRDRSMALAVIEGDDTIDDFEIDLEQRCIALCGYEGLPDEDLRTIVTFLKIITEFERIADHATDIAEIVLRLVDSKVTLMGPTDHIVRLTTLTSKMLSDGIKAFFDGDAELAKEVILADTDVDETYERMYSDQIAYLAKGHGIVRSSQAIDLLLVARYLERIADHATNLGEYCIFMVTGERVAHQKLAPYPKRELIEELPKPQGILERLFGNKGK